MSAYNESKIYAYKAGADLTDQEFKAVKLVDGKVVLALATEGVGILMSSTALDGVAEVALPGGGGKARLGGVVSEGDSLTAAADGRLVVATAGQRAIAVALESGLENDRINCEIQVHSVPA